MSIFDQAREFLDKSVLPVLTDFKNAVYGPPNASPALTKDQKRFFKNPQTTSNSIVITGEDVQLVEGFNAACLSPQETSATYYVLNYLAQTPGQKVNLIGSLNDLPAFAPFEKEYREMIGKTVPQSVQNLFDQIQTTATVDKQKVFDLAVRAGEELGDNVTVTAERYKMTKKFLDDNGFKATDSQILAVSRVDVLFGEVKARLDQADKILQPMPGYEKATVTEDLNSLKEIASRVRNFMPSW